MPTSSFFSIPRGLHRDVIELRVLRRRRQRTGVDIGGQRLRAAQAEGGDGEDAAAACGGENNDNNNNNKGQ